MFLLAIRLPAFQPTDITGLVTAVSGIVAIASPLVFSFQESGSHAHINVAPGKQLIQRTLSLGIKAGFQPGLGKGT